ncbi:MAG: hypothetical protein KAY24_17720 [Candidatus Eisenbacteria sp.]|nr:hypothetical protein [Candidatus Eisenbacteria bacterium]
MHAGSIDGMTAAARVYRVLKSEQRWIGGYELQDRAETTAVSTRVSEVRHQLPETEAIEMKQEGHRFFYRWKRVPVKKTTVWWLA